MVLTDFTYANKFKVEVHPSDSLSFFPLVPMVGVGVFSAVLVLTKHFLLIIIRIPLTSKIDTAASVYAYPKSI